MICNELTGNWSIKVNGTRLKTTLRKNAWYLLDELMCKFDNDGTRYSVIDVLGRVRNVHNT